MARSRLWWVAFALVQITLPAVTAWAVTRTATVQDVRTPAQPPGVVGEAHIVRIRGYPIVWDVRHWHYDLSPAGEPEGDGQSVGFAHWMLPVLQLLLALTLPGTFFTIYCRRPSWFVRWVRMFFLTAVATSILTMADLASERNGVCRWNEIWSPLGPALRKPIVQEAVEWLAERRDRNTFMSTYPPRGSPRLSARCLFLSLIVITLACRPWRPQAQPEV